MGSLSELGPIDPQFEGIPALALKYSIEHLAELAKRYPAATEMFSNYLAKSLKIEELGYYERVAESATHYAQRLPKSRINASATPPEDIVRRLVYEYKDHSFAIDTTEAAEIFGTEVVKRGTPEYHLTNKLYKLLNFLENIFWDFHDRHFYFTGTAESGCELYMRKRRTGEA